VGCQRDFRHGALGSSKYVDDYMAI
jgi:hypothetical protein